MRRMCVAALRLLLQLEIYWLSKERERVGGINLQFSIYKFNSDIQITKINKLKENKSQFSKEVDMLRLLKENT